MVALSYVVAMLIAAVVGYVVGVQRTKKSQGGSSGTKVDGNDRNRPE